MPAQVTERQYQGQGHAGSRPLLSPSIDHPGRAAAPRPIPAIHDDMSARDSSCTRPWYARSVTGAGMMVSLSSR